jgi:surface antigen
MKGLMARENAMMSSTVRAVGHIHYSDQVNGDNTIRICRTHGGELRKKF